MSVIRIEREKVLRGADRKHFLQMAGGFHNETAGNEKWRAVVPRRDFVLAEHAVTCRQRIAYPFTIIFLILMRRFDFFRREKPGVIRRSNQGR